MQTPRFAASLSRMWSGTLRGWSQRYLAEEWEKITGAMAVSSAAAIVASATLERSTSIPSRCISATTRSPNSLSPPARGTSVAESAQSRLLLWVSVM